MPPKDTEVDAALSRVHEALVKHGLLSAAAWELGLARGWTWAACWRHRLNEQPADALCPHCQSETRQRWSAALCNQFRGNHRFRLGAEVLVIAAHLLGYDPANLRSVARGGRKAAKRAPRRPRDQRKERPEAA